MQNQNRISEIDKTTEDTETVLDMKAMVFQKPVVEYIDGDSIKNLDEETIAQLERSVSGGGSSFSHFLQVRDAVTNFYRIDPFQDRDTVLNVRPTIDFNSVDSMNAIAYMMYLIQKEYSKEMVFVEASYQVTFDDEDSADVTVGSRKNASLKASHYQINTARLANYLYASYYHKTYFISMANEEDRKNTYYVFDHDNLRWGRVGLSGLRKIIKNDVKKLMTVFNMPSKGMITTMNEVVNFIEGMIQRIDDMEDDILEQFSKQHPYLVQFKDLVYNMDTHQVAKMSYQFRLKHYHPYRIPTGTLDVDSLTPEDGFVDVPSSLESVYEQASIVIERLGILYRENQLDFVMSALGNAFCHDASRFQVAIASVGGGGLGKSFLFNELIANMMFNGYVASIDQQVLNNRSNFMFSQLVGKELNIISELNDSIMSRDIIHMIKSVNSGDRLQIEFKNQSAYNSSLYAKTFMLSNENQLPSMRTSDVDDSGFKRRFVVAHCNPKQEDTSWQLRFTHDLLREAVPAFSLACMMTFIKHYQNGNIAKFHYNEGCSKEVVEGFTTIELVNSTRAYFKSHDRFRMFMHHLPEVFIREMSFSPLDDTRPHYDKTMEGFKTWLACTNYSHFNGLFKDWHSNEFTSMKGAREFPKMLKERHDIERKSKKVGGRTIKVYGEKFAELVESVCLEDDPESLRELIIED